MDSPLSILTGSEVRAALLGWLARARAPASVSAIARDLGFTPRGVRREVERLEGLGIVRVERVGSQDRVLPERGSPLFGPLSRLVAVTAEGSRSRGPDPSERLLAEAAALGAPVGTPPARRLRRPKEEAVVDMVDEARRNATLLRTLPVLLQRQAPVLDWPALEREARRRRLASELGMMLALTGELSGDPGLQEQAERLRDARRTRTRWFHAEPSSRYAAQLALWRTPEVVRSWGFLMNMEEADFRRTLERHAPA